MPTPGQFYAFRIETNLDNYGTRRWEFWIASTLVKPDYGYTFVVGSRHDVGVEVNFAAAQYEPQQWSSIAQRNAAGSWIAAASYAPFEQDVWDGYRLLQYGGANMVPCMNDPIARCDSIFP